MLNIRFDKSLTHSMQCKHVNVCIILLSHIFDTFLTLVVL